MKINFGCGLGKITGFVNVDIDPELNPDLIVDVIGPLPWDNSSVDHITMYHTLEHLDKNFWSSVFLEFSRILKKDGTLTLTFPEYPICFNFWQSNHRGLKEFWEACIFGRGTSIHDRHISITSREEVIPYLLETGFEITLESPEPYEEQYSVIKARNLKAIIYEDLLRDHKWTDKQSEQESPVT